jgi:hypothetical protein
MSDEPKSDRLDLRGTLDLISNAFRTAGTANATGAITAGASYRFFSDKPDLRLIRPTRRPALSTKRVVCGPEIGRTGFMPFASLDCHTG